MYFEGELPTVSYGNGNCNNGWGDWSWIIGLALVGGLFGGWGNSGFGFGGGHGFGYGAPATQADLANGFAQNTLQRGIDDIILGQASMQNFINQGFAGLNATINSGFAGVDNAVCTLGYNTQAGFNALANQIASCCCDLKSINLENRYLNAQQTCEIVSAINAGNQRLVDIYTADKLAALTAENVALKGQISDDRQADRIINKLSPCPSPAYVVPNPNCCYNYGVYPTGACGASVQ